MNDTDKHDAELELVADLHSEYVKPNLEVLENFSKGIDVTISIGI